MNLNGTLLENNSGQISIETILLLVIFQKYYKELVFDVVNIASYNIILEII